MDNIPSGLSEKSCNTGSGRGLSNGPSFRRPPGSRPVSATGLPDGSSLPTPNHLPFQQVTITVFKDEKGYGMKVSGDNPVYVQSVKEGGAAERAGLHSGDKIIKVNGVNVTHSTHTEVVELIKSSTQVVLTVQQRPKNSSLPSRPPGTPVLISSPSMPIRSLHQHTNHHHHSAPSRDRITGPQPVDFEKKRQMEHQRVHTLNLMLEKEQRFVEALRSELAKSNDHKLQEQLVGAERRVQTVQQQLLNLSNTDPEPVSPTRDIDIPPPLPSRNSPCPPIPQSPPPLPPRQYLLAQSEASATSNHASPGGQVHTHHRTKSNPDTLHTHNLSLVEASKRLIASESMSELNFAKQSKGGLAWDVDSPRVTPPGTPPPPYGGANPPAQGETNDESDNIQGEPPPTSDGATDASPVRPIPAFATNQPQSPIISMEDDEMSDQEMSQLEDHGPFKSLSKLWNHHAHLAVFMNYVISNSDPSSLLFYLVTDLYKEGNAKEMKKWAYEIHSSFLVPGAPLRLNNVDENVAREIDEVLLNEYDKEEILRKVFWKARAKAKEELNEQLADFQQKRTAGLGTLFGPSDAQLDESIHDKSKELKIVESILVPKLEPFMEDIEKDVVEDKRFTTGAALGTVMGKVFGIRGQTFSSLLDRCPTFVSKDKSLKAKLIGKTRKVTVRGHHFVAHQYYTVTYCNHCQMIIWGIGPQGYQCSNCALNIHRNCVKVLDENCPGPMVKKEKGNDRISKLMERIRPENTRRKPSTLSFAQAERIRRQQEEAECGSFTDNESGERPASGPRGQEKRPDPVSEERGSSVTTHDADDDSTLHHDLTHHVTKSKPSSTSINRSESYKERIHQKRQLRERRKTSDPNLSKSNKHDPHQARGTHQQVIQFAKVGCIDVDLDNQALSYNSGSSSNSSLSTRSLDSPSNSLEAVSGGVPRTGEAVTPQNCSSVSAGWDSDTEVEADPPDWKNKVPEDILKQLSAHEVKRQEIINELFHTEKSHVRGLKVLDKVFYRPMKDQQILPSDQLQLLFANLEEMLDIHSQFNNSMKSKRKEGPVIGEIGDLLYSMFEGPEGESFQQAAATFCAQKQIALKALNEWRRKDPKLNSFLNDAELNPVCRRLQLKDIIPGGMFRLTKYPLLLKNLEKYTTSGTEEAVRVTRAEQRSKEILNFVNAAVKEAEDQHRLAEIQRRLDKSPFDKFEHPLASEFRNLDLTKHRLIHEGALNWRITNRPKPVDLHVLLTEDVIILLQKQDEKYVLKFYSTTFSPVIKVSTVLVRNNAVDKKGIFLVNTSQNGAQIYDLVATSSSEKRQWFKHISDAAEAYKQREGRHRRPDPATTPAQDDTAPQDKTKEPDEGVSSSDLLSPPRPSNGADIDSPSPNSDATPLPSGESTPQASPSSGTPVPTHPETPEPVIRKMGEGLSPSPVRKAAEPLRLTTAESPLIEPSEVLISQRPVLTAEHVFTPLEKLRRLDESIKQALLEKQQLVAEILHVPKDEYENFTEMAAEPAKDKETCEIVLAAVSQASKLWSIVNEALKVTEEEAVSATSEVSAGGLPRRRLPLIPAHKLQMISNSLNSELLPQLLNKMTARDEERERLRQEVQRLREQLHALYERYDHIPEPSAEVPTIDIDALPENDQSTEGQQNVAAEVFVDALSGEAESNLEAEAAATVESEIE